MAPVYCFALFVYDAFGREVRAEVEVTVFPCSPVINFFRANVAEIAPGDVITLEWRTTGGAQARLSPLAVIGQVDQAWAVALTDSMNYTSGR